ncbi:MAG: hypothetical protein HFJ41_01630 [Clostridia bacterium]|nr:hypothetical protein [Clostridia bacterium]
MRKILLSIIIVLLLVITYFSLFKGIEIGNLKISSIKQIDENSKLLDEKITEANNKIDIDYPKKREDLKQANDKMREAEERYVAETNASSDKELEAALEIESFDIEKLWTKLGNYARAEEVNLKLVLNRSSSGSTDTKDLSFTVNGSYVGITNFIYDIEDDDQLKFRIYNYKMLPYQNGILQATFIVKDVRITSSSLNESLPSSSGVNTTTEGQNTDTQSTTKH